MYVNLLKDSKCVICLQSGEEEEIEQNTVVKPVEIELIVKRNE